MVTLFLLAEQDTGQTSGRTLRDNAFALLDRCVNEEGRGGIVTNFGKPDFIQILWMYGSKSS